MTQPGPIERIAQAVTSGHMSATQVVEHALERMSALNPELNLLVDTFADEALHNAATHPATGLLAGVPVLVKDLEDVAGHQTRQGSAAMAGVAPAAQDSMIPKRVKQHGAIVVGKSTLPEFAIEGFTASAAQGITRNPWNLELSPGGSSGGSAAAVAAGMVPIATATDGGGSIRVPAAFCGLVGIKPTNGVVGRWPAQSWIDLSTEGPFATTVNDLRILMRAISGPTHGDPAAFPPLDFTPVELAELTIVAMERTSDLGPLPAEVHTVFHDGVEELAQVIDARITWRDPGTLFTSGDPDLDWFNVCSVEHIMHLGRAWVVENFNELDKSTQEFFAAGLEVTVDEYIDARRRRYEYVFAMDELLGTNAILVTPTVAQIGWLADGRLTADTAPGLLPPEVYATAMQNIVGLPAMSLPWQRYSNGLPGSIQITGPRLSDSMLLDIGQRWESVHPWQRVAPGYEPFDSFLD